MPAKQTESQSQVSLRSLRSVPFFADFAPKEIGTLLSAGTVRAFAEGKTIRPSRRGRGELVILLKGKAKACQTIGRGQSKLLEVMGPGRLVAGLAALGGGISPFSVVALTPCACFHLRLEALEALTPERPQLAARVFSRLLQEAGKDLLTVGEHFQILARLYLKYRPAARRCPVFSECLAVSGGPLLRLPGASLPRVRL